MRRLFIGKIKVPQTLMNFPICNVNIIVNCVGTVCYKLTTFSSMLFFVFVFNFLKVIHEKL